MHAGAGDDDKHGEARGANLSGTYKADLEAQTYKDTHKAEARGANLSDTPSPTLAALSEEEGRLGGNGGGAGAAGQDGAGVEVLWLMPRI